MTTITKELKIGNVIVNPDEIIIHDDGYFSFKDTHYHLAFRDMGGTSRGYCYPYGERISVHITRIWKYAMEDGENFWFDWLEVEHHEFIHALMKRWRIKGWTSEKKVDWATDKIMEHLETIVNPSLDLN
jgi:hypothetical protein